MSIVFDLAILNEYFDTVCPLSVNRKNFAKKNLILALVRNPTTEQVRYLREILALVREFISEPRHLRLSIIKPTGIEVVGEFQKFYWRVNYKYAQKLNLDIVREPHIPF